MPSEHVILNHHFLILTRFPNIHSFLSIHELSLNLPRQYETPRLLGLHPRRLGQLIKLGEMSISDIFVLLPPLHQRSIVYRYE